VDEKRNKKLIFFATTPTVRREYDEAQSNSTDLPKKSTFCAGRLQPDKLG